MMRTTSRPSFCTPMIRSSHAFSRCVSLAVALILAGASTFAADKPRTGSFGKGRANAPLLTRVELRECLAMQERVRLLGVGIVATQAALDKEKAEIAHSSTELSAQLAALDRTRAEAVDAHNASVAAHDKRIDAYNASTPVFNAKIEALQSGRTQFAKSCENRDFDEKDEIAIRKGQ